MSEVNIFECRRCGFCCQGVTTVSLNAEDLARLGAHLQLSPAELKERYLVVSSSGKTIQMRTVDGHCIFYDNGCGVHQGRPWRCRQWPLHPSMVDDSTNFEAIRNSCPGFKTGLSHEEYRLAVAGVKEDKG